MKNYIILFLILFLSCKSSKQNHSNSFSNNKVFFERVRNVIEYGIEKKIFNNSLIVSDTIISINISYLRSKIAELKNRESNDRKFINELDIIDEEFHYKNFTIPINKELNIKPNKSNNKGFFSKSMNDFIMLEIFDTDFGKSIPELPKDNNYFGESEIYIFFFNKNNTVKDFTSITIYYN